VGIRNHEDTIDTVLDFSEACLLSSEISAIQMSLGVMYQTPHSQR